MEINIGIAEQDRAAIAEGLSRLLADTYTLYLKTHNFHWNVTGPMFNTLHLMFEGQYTELALAVDQIAERIRALGFPAPGTYAAYARLSSIKEEEGVPSAEDMIKQFEFVRKEASDLEKIKEQRRAEILERIGHASKVITSFGSLSTGQVKGRSGTLITPEMVGTVIGATEGYRSFRFYPKKEK